MLPTIALIPEDWFDRFLQAKDKKRVEFYGEEKEKHGHLEREGIGNCVNEDSVFGSHQILRNSLVISVAAHLCTVLVGQDMNKLRNP